MNQRATGEFGILSLNVPIILTKFSPNGCDFIYLPAMCKWFTSYFVRNSLWESEKLAIKEANDKRQNQFRVEHPLDMKINNVE